VKVFEEVLDRRKTTLGPKHADTLASMKNLLAGYQLAGLLDKAEPMLRDRMDRYLKKEGLDSPYTGEAMAHLGENLLWQKKYDQAETVLRDCVAIADKTMSGHWAPFAIRSMLGGALLGQKKYADAEPFLIEGYEGMLKRQAQIPPQGQVRLTEAIQRLVELYEATGQTEKAEQWRKKAKSEGAPGRPFVDR
jgi:hypothetical protein